MLLLLLIQVMLEPLLFLLKVHLACWQLSLLLSVAVSSCLCAAFCRVYCSSQSALALDLCASKGGGVQAGTREGEPRQQPAKSLMLVSRHQWHVICFSLKFVIGEVPASETPRCHPSGLLKALTRPSHSKLEFIVIQADEFAVVHVFCLLRHGEKDFGAKAQMNMKLGPAVSYQCSIFFLMTHVCFLSVRGR